jgi:hypothetical protein
MRGILPEGSVVTSDRARKQAVRARMTVTGEPYATAARMISTISRDAADVVM